jgi:hypothetical protein
MRLLAVTAVAVAAAAVLSVGPALTAVPAAQTPARQAPADATVPFRVGETLTYDVSWSRFLTAGTAVTRVIERKPSNGTVAYAVLAEGRPLPLIQRLYPVYYKMDALIDTRTLLSHWTSLFMDENGRKRQTTMTFDRTKRQVLYEVPTEPGGLKDTFAMPSNTQDGLSVLFSLRARTPSAGARLTIPVADDGAMYTAEIFNQGVEKVSVPFGTVDAWNLRLRILNTGLQEVAKNVGVWISTDARRLPVRIEAELIVGTFGLALRVAQ